MALTKTPTRFLSPGLRVFRHLLVYPLRLLGFLWPKHVLRAFFYPPSFRGMYARFNDAIREYVQRDDIVLDAGCGSGNDFHVEIRGCVRRVIGLDREPEPGKPGIRGNAYVDDKVFGDLGELPLPDASVDAIILCHVAEHISKDDVEAVFREVVRVLRIGGRLLLLTPNRWHYVPILARVIPNCLHPPLKRLISGLDESDVFPTEYAANTAGRLRELAAGAGLEVERLDRFETEPEYLAFHIVPYALGVVYERVVNRLGVLAPLRVSLLLVARRIAPA